MNEPSVIQRIKLRALAQIADMDARAIASFEDRDYLDENKNFLARMRAEYPEYTEEVMNDPWAITIANQL